MNISQVALSLIAGQLIYDRVKELPGIKEGFEEIDALVNKLMGIRDLRGYYVPPPDWLHDLGFMAYLEAWSEGI